MTWDREDGIFRRLKALIGLRRATTGPTRGLTGHKTRVDIHGRVLVVERWIEPPQQPGTGHVVAVLNFGETDAKPPVWFPFSGEWHVEFNASTSDYDSRFGISMSPSDIEVANNQAEVDVSSLSAVVLTPARRNA